MYASTAVALLTFFGFAFFVSAVISPRGKQHFPSGQQRA
jgi:hypothetical protein